jgi:NADH:ubiquinone oxidoreductase subunit 5 (subunit L)/multisubunit Na+/H+ antiporter MnhA subunit
MRSLPVSEPTSLALLALGLPLASALLVTLMGPFRWSAKLAHLPTILAFAGAAVASIILLIHVAGVAESGPVAFQTKPWTWFSTGVLNVTFTITVDPLSAVMLTTVTFVATWIAIFSSGYMHGDPGYARYFGVMSLFVFAM